MDAAEPSSCDCQLWVSGLAENDRFRRNGALLSLIGVLQVLADFVEEMGDSFRTGLQLSRSFLSFAEK